VFRLAILKIKSIQSVGLVAWLIVGVLGVTCLVYCSQRSPKAPATQAVLVVPNSVHDFGETSLQQIWQASFSIRNAGGRRLVLNELDQGCDCDDRISRTILISPGETTVVDAILDTRDADGLVETITRFTTNDPALPHIDLITRARVTPLAASPATIEDRTQISVLVRE
jgi:hypothetical protein